MRAFPLAHGLAVIVLAACTAAPTQTPTTIPPAAPPSPAGRPSTPPTAAPIPTAAPTATATQRPAAAPTTAGAPAPTLTSPTPPPSRAATATPTELPRTLVRVQRAEGSPVEVKVEIAADQSARARGLMFRTALAADAGMLFVFPNDTEGPFWMMDTYVPLSIAFIAADGRIVSIKDMQPRSTELTYPGARYRFALEVNQGFFERAGIRAGDRAEIPG